MPENKSRDTLFVIVRGLKWKYYGQPSFNWITQIWFGGPYLGQINDKIIFDWYRIGHLRPRPQFQCCSFVTSTSGRGTRHVILVLFCFFTLSLIAFTQSTLKLGAGASDSESLSHNLQELFIDYLSQVWTDVRRIFLTGCTKVLNYIFTFVLIISASLPWARLELLDASKQT